MNIKKSLAGLLALVMIVTSVFTPTFNLSVFAADDTAPITGEPGTNAEQAPDSNVSVDKPIDNTNDGTVPESGKTVNVSTYTELQEAINNAAEGDKIVLTANIEFTAVDGEPESHIWVKTGKKVIIDLDGRTVTGAFFIDGTATIKNGTIVNKDTVSGIETKGTLTLENMTVTSNRHAVRVSGGKTTIVSGTYETNGTSGTRHTINASGSETVLNILGGKFYGAGHAKLGASGNCVMDQGCASVTISGGEFYGANGVEGPVCAASNTVISGGKFEDTTETWRYHAKTATGKVAVKNGNIYEVVDAVAEVNGVYYGTLTDAIAAANAGDTILVLAAEIELPVITKAGLIFKAAEGGTKITNEILNTNSDGGWRIDGTTFDGFEFTQRIGLIGKDLTIKECTFTGSSGIYYGCANGEWNVVDCTFDNKVYALQIGEGNGVVNVTGCTIKGGFNTYGCGGVNFNNCTFEKGTTYNIVQTHSTMTLTDCTFSADWPKGDDGYNFVGAASDNAVVELYGDNKYEGGSIFDLTCTERGIFVVNPEKDDNGLYTAGAFYNAPANSKLAEGFTPIKNADGSYGVISSDTIVISTVDELITFANAVNNGTNYAGKTVVLGANIDLSNTPWAGIGVYKDSTKSFHGTFDGQGYTISGVTFTDASNGNATSEANNYRGFFNQIDNATVKNLTVSGAVWATAPASTEYGGALIVGCANDSTIENCVAIGTVNGTHNVAGVVVRVKDSNIIKCTNKADLTGSYTKMGGIAALVQNSATSVLFEGCINEGTINSTARGEDGVGGIVGWVGYPNTANVTFKNCVNKGAISYTATATVGQIVAESWNGGHVFEGNKGLNNGVPATGHSAMSGLNYAEIGADGMLTYVNTIEAGKTYIVTSVSDETGGIAKPTIKLTAGQSITFDISNASINDSGITVTGEGVTLVKSTEGNLVTYTAKAPWNRETIENLDDLLAFVAAVNGGDNFEGKTVTLMNDIDLTGTPWAGIGIYSETTVGTAFSGTFDGQGHKITGVTFADTGSNKYRGFFNQLYKATVKNVTIETNGFGYTADQIGSMPSSMGGAAIAGHAIASTIENCVAEGTFVGSHNVAGIVVLIQGSTIKNCINKANLTGSYSKLGGIVNFSQHKGVDANYKGSLIENCVNVGTITSTARGENGVGGIIGWIGYGSYGADASAEYAVTIKNCENKGAITAAATTKVGQIVGSGESYIADGGNNKGLTTTFGIGDNNGYFAYAVVVDGVATYVSTLEAGKTYLVTAPGVKPTIELQPGKAITFDETLAKIDASGITAETEIKTETVGNITTYTAEIIPVASIGDVQYGSLQDAINAANANDVIVLLGNTTEAMVTVTAGKNVVIDFKGFTLNGSMLVEKGATADIKNGTIYQTESVAGIEVQGVATLTNMDITSEGRHAIRVDGLNTEGTHLTVNSGTYTTKADPNNISAYAVNAGEMSTVVINGGTFVGNGGAQGAFIVKSDNTNVTINNCIITNGDAIVMQLAASTVIYGGNFAKWTASYDNYLAEGKVAVLNENGTYDVVDATAKNETTGKYYATLAEAITAAKDGETVKLLADVESGAITISGMALTLELNGKTLTGVNTGTGTFNFINLTNAAGLTIQDSSAEQIGKIVAPGRVINTSSSETAETVVLKSGIIESTVYRATGAVYSGKNDSFTMNGGTIRANGGISGVQVAANGKFVMTGGLIVANDRVEAHNDGSCIFSNGSSSKDTVIEISGGKIENKTTIAIYHPQVGVLNVSGNAEIIGATAIYMKAGTLNVSGGTITANGEANDYSYSGNGASATGDAIVIDNCNYPGDAPSANITGGVFESANGVQIGAYYGGTATEIAEIVSTNTSLSAPAGYKWSEEGKLVAKEYVAEVNGVKYETLAEAIAAANAGDVITMVGNDLTVGGIEITKDITIDLNGFTISNENAERKPGAIFAVNNSVLTIKDTEGTGKIIAALDLTPEENKGHKGNDPTIVSDGSNTSNRGSLVIEGGSFISTGNVNGHNGYLFETYYLDSVTINGGTFNHGNQTNGLFRINNNQTIKVSNGVFSTDELKSYVDFGYKLELQTEGAYSGMYKYVEGYNINSWTQVADTTWYNKDDKEFTLTSAAQLAGLAELVNNDNGNDFAGITIKLGANIDLGAYELNGEKFTDIKWAPIGNYSKVFNGTFDGNGYTVSNIAYTNSTDDAAAFIGHIGSKALLVNVKLNGVNISGRTYVAALVAMVAAGGRVYGCSVENATLNGKQEIGFICANNGGGWFINNTVDGKNAEIIAGGTTVIGNNVVWDNNGCILTGTFLNLGYTGNSYNPNLAILHEHAIVTRDDENDVWKVTRASVINSSTGVKYETLQEAVNAAVSGNKIKLLVDITITDGNADPIIIDKDLTVDFGEYTLFLNIPDATASTKNWYGIRIKTGNVTLKGTTGGIKTADNKELYALQIGKSTSDKTEIANPVVTIEGGVYYGGTSAVSISYGAVEIKGGFFEAYTNDKQYTINLIDASKETGDATLAVSGGQFKDWNPGCNTADGAHSHFTAEGYIGVADENNVYTVQPGTYVAQTTTTCYTTLADAIAAANDGETVTLLADATVNATIDLTKSVTIELNGKVVTLADGVRLGATGAETVLTINNGTINGNRKGVLFLIYQGATLNMTAVTAVNAYDDLTSGNLIQIGSMDNAGYATLNNCNLTATATALMLLGNKEASDNDTNVQLINSTLKADHAINTNGNYVSNLTVNGGYVEGYSVEGGSIGIYWPSKGTLTVKGDVTVTGATAIYVKSGKVVINSGNISATGAKTAFEHFGNGAKATGEAIVVESCGYPGGAANVAINGGTITSANSNALGYYVDSNNGESAETATVAKGNEVEMAAPFGYAWDEGKLVKVEVLGAKTSYIRYLNKDTGKYEIFLISGIDSTGYTEVGFIVTIGNQTVRFNTTDVYSSITDGTGTKFTSADYSTNEYESNKLFIVGINFPVDFAKENTLTYQSYAVKKDGTVIYGMKSAIKGNICNE